MITLNLFTSGKHTQPLIETLKRAKNIKLVNIFNRLPDLSADFVGRRRLRRPKAEASAKADVFLIADFGQIIPPEILAIPKHGSLCLHPSLLPKYRGASPVQFAIINGERETGITIFKMDEKIDHGPIIAQFKEEIRDDDTAENLYERLFAAGGQVLVTILPAWVESRIKPRKQDHKKAIYTKILTREDGKVDWKKSDEKIERFIRAMYPWPGAWTVIADFSPRPKKRALKCAKTKRLKLLKAHLEKSPITDHRSPITKLVLDEVQLEGKKPVSWKQFMEGYPEAKLT